MLKSTRGGSENSYSSCMVQEHIEATVMHESTEDRWAAWQARGAANDRATRRNLFILASILIVAMIILNVWLIR